MYIINLSLKARERTSSSSSFCELYIGSYSRGSYSRGLYIGSSFGVSSVINLRTAAVEEQEQVQEVMGRLVQVEMLYFC